MADVFTDRDQLLRRPVFPGMDAAESRALRQYIRRQGDGVNEWRFNVRVGPGTDAGAPVDQKTRDAWMQLTRARLDCVAWRSPSSATLIEAKDRWENDAVWQLLSYRDLYAADNPTHAIALVGVARVASNTARELARTKGIALYLYDLPPAALPDVGERASEETI